MNSFNVGIIGLGNRGKWWATEMLPMLKCVNITGVCDVYQDRIDDCCSTLNEKFSMIPVCKTTNYEKLIEDSAVDVVLVFSSWDNHFPAIMKAMKLRKPIATEVGGAYSIEQCYDLIKVYEETKTPFMMLENCCYGRTELTLLNMARKKKFGTIVHCEGGYMHDLRNEVAYGIKNRHYRFNEYKNRNCDNYPTHDIGPLAKILNINRGNRFLSLVSMTSKSCGLNEYINNHDDLKNEYGKEYFCQGDICTTLIKCANGETINLTLDTTLPRYYCRNMTVRGTKGLYEEISHSFLFEGENDIDEFEWNKHLNNENQYFEKWLHPIWRKYEQEGVIEAGHGGMDFLVIDAFFTALDKGYPMPIDVYDAVTWMCISCLSEKSIALGSMSVDFPDFTGGKWYKPDKAALWEYNINH